MILEAELLSADLVSRLEQLAIVSKQRIRGTMQGKRRSVQQGSSLEFADYRLYTPGDDIRQLDWNAYGRTGKPFIKLFMDEQELQVSLYVDASASMSVQVQGPNSKAVNKWLYARQLAACIGYLTLCHYDRVNARMFSTMITERTQPLRGKASVSHLLQFLQNAKLREEGDIAEALVHPASMPTMPGMSWVFSDFLYERGVEEAIGALLSARQEVVVVQVLSREELDPAYTGDLRLIDVENGIAKDVAISTAVLKKYRQAAEQYTMALQSYCYERGVAYCQVVTDTPLWDAINRVFRMQGLLR